MMPRDTNALSEQALTLIESGNLSQACALYEQICQIDPQNADARMMLGAVKGELGHTADACADLQEAIRLRPEFAEAHIQLGNLMRLQGRFQEAVDHLRQAVTLEQEYTEAWIVLGGLYGLLHQMEEAEYCCRRVLELQPDSVDAYVNLANTQFEQGNLDDAAENYRKALAKHADLPMAWLMLGRIHERAERLQEAENSFRQALAQDPAFVEAHLELGNVLKAGNRVDEARAHYEQALRLNPDEPEAHAALASVLIMQDRLHDALASCQQALRLKPHQPIVHYNLGVLLQKLGRSTAEAEAHYREAVRLKPDFVEAHHNLGRLLMAKGGMLSARDNFEQILRYQPDNAIARYILAVLGATPAPSTAPPDYVTKLFDDYADGFDKHVVQELEYRIPERLRNAVGHVLGQSKGQFNVLDLGCGTGLCGVLFRDIASRLTGVDLSAKMIDKANERGVYDELILADLAKVLRTPGAAYDLIIAADVFIYVGELASVFEACKAALKPGGYFAFSLEAADDAEACVLRPSGRYAHSIGYIRRLAQSQTLQEIDLDHVTVRKEKGHAIPGYIFILRQPSS